MIELLIKFKKKSTAAKARTTQRMLIAVDLNDLFSSLYKIKPIAPKTTKLVPPQRIASNANKAPVNPTGKPNFDFPIIFLLKIS